MLSHLHCLTVCQQNEQNNKREKEQNEVYCEQSTAYERQNRKKKKHFQEYRDFNRTFLECLRHFLRLAGWWFEPS